MSALARLQPHYIYTEPADAGQKGLRARCRDDGHGPVAADEARGAHGARDRVAIGPTDGPTDTCVSCVYYVLCVSVCVCLLWHLWWYSNGLMSTTPVSVCLHTLCVHSPADDMTISGGIVLCQIDNNT